MAKRGKGRGGESISGYFREVFKERPDLLFAKSNAELIDRWNADHPSQPASDKVKQNLANIKSVLRKQERMGGRRPKVATATMATSNSRLEVLEEHIDDALSMAKHLDREGLESVIKHLRTARNQVVWKLGQ